MAVLPKQRIKDGKTKPTRYYSHKQETFVAKELGGKVQPNSGATMFAKGDVVLDDWLIEAKTSTKDQLSFAIKKGWLEKNLQESLFIGKPYNALSFNFGPGQNNYYVIDEQTFKQCVELLHKYVV